MTEVVCHCLALLSSPWVVVPSAAKRRSVCAVLERVWTSWARVRHAFPLHMEGSSVRRSPHFGRPQGGMACGLTLKVGSGMNCWASPVSVVVKFVHHVTGTGNGRSCSVGEVHPAHTVSKCLRTCDLCGSLQKRNAAFRRSMCAHVLIGRMARI